MTDLYATYFICWLNLLNYGWALRNWKRVSLGTETYQEHALHLRLSMVVFQHVPGSPTHTHNFHALSIWMSQNIPYTTHQLLVIESFSLQLRFAAPDPMKSATRPQLSSVHFVGDIACWKRSPGFPINCLLLVGFSWRITPPHDSHILLLGSARIWTARRPDEFQVPIFFVFLPWLVKRQKEPWASSWSSCCLVHCTPWSLTTPRLMERCCTPRIPRQSWAKSSRWFS